MKIFLVDDEYINNVISTKILMKIDGTLQLIKFTNPLQAYDEMEAHKPDLVLLDLNMPQFSGWQYLDKMKTEQVPYPVVILTSSVCKPDSARARTYENVIGYAEKPLNADEISQYIMGEFPRHWAQ